MRGRGGGGDRDRRPAAVSSAIHRGLTGARELVGTAYLADAELRRGYLREIAPRTEVALARILGEAFAGGQAGDAARPLRAVDLGAGTGAAGAALRAHFGEGVSVLEADKHASAPGRRAVDVTSAADLATLGVGFDLVVAAHVLNELYFDAAPEAREATLAALVERWLDRLLAPAGTLILLEPALRETSRVLLRVRDRLCAAGGIHVVAPCFRQAGCPALLRERDWCHDSVRAPDLRRVDFSYLVIRRGARALPDGGLCRVVSDPLPEKGKLRLFVCGAEGRAAVVRLDRHASAANADLAGLGRGDVARFEPGLAMAEASARSDGLRIGSDTRVERIARPGAASAPRASRSAEEVAQDPDDPRDPSRT